MRFLIILLMFLCTSARAEEQLEFKGLALGSELSSVQNSGKYLCAESDFVIADTMCRLLRGEKETIAGKPIYNLMLFFYGGKLQTIAIYFQKQYFSDVSSSLIERYGQGTVTESTIQNRMGASFENKTIVWRKGSSTVKAKRYSSDLDTSSVIFQTDSSVDEYKKRKGSSAKENAKDL